VLQDAVSDFRHGARLLRRSPLFTFAALATMALGVAAVTTIFAVVHAVVLRPLPFRDPERLVALWESNPERGWVFTYAAPANVLDWRERAGSFEDVAAHGGVGRMSLSGDGEPERISGAYVTGNFFSVLGITPRLGRGFSMEETWKGASDVVVLGHGLWRRRFGSDPEIVGRRVQIDAQARTVVGVAPEGFRFPSRETDLWVPLGWDPAITSEFWFRRAHFLWPIARLRAEATLESARAELAAVARKLEEEYPETNRAMGAGATPLHEWITGDTRRSLLLILASAGLVLLAACANVGSLVLARATGRAREMAVRGALGAGRLRLVRQILAESLLLGALGGALAVVLSILSLPALVAVLPEEIPRLHEVRFGAEPLAFGLAASLATALLFGLFPALSAGDSGIGTALRGSGRGITRRSGWSRQAIVASEVALAVILTTGAVLFLRSFHRLTQVPAGFEAKGVWTATVDLPRSKHDGNSALRFHEEILERLSQRPGVAAAATDHLPLTGLHWTEDFLFEGRPEEEAGVEFHRRVVSPGYFRTMGVPLLEGRDFLASDSAHAPPVVIVNQSVRRQFFGAEDALGKRIAFENERPIAWMTIVGVVADEKLESLSAPNRPEIFVPLAQQPERALRYVWKSDAEPEALARAFRAEVSSLDPDVPLDGVGPLESVVEASVARPRLLLTLLGGFASVALFLAALGVYGVIALGVSERRNELSIRMALGARAGALVRMAAVQSLRAVTLGLLVGLLSAIALAGALSGQLYGVRARDPWTFAIVGAAVAISTALASYLPARRVVRLDPIAHLRCE
jgi:predicted permease